MFVYLAKLHVLVLLGLDYPSQPPHFILNLQWEGQHSAATDTNIRVSLRSTNVYIK